MASSVSTEWECTHERAYWFDDTFFTKRETFPHEYIRNLEGQIVSPPTNSKARLENEFNILQFIKANSNIPVPEAELTTVMPGSLPCLQTKIANGVQLSGAEAAEVALADAEVLSLRTKLATGIPLCDVGVDDLEAAIARVDIELKESILPQMAALRSDTLGGLNREHEYVLTAPWVGQFSRPLCRVQSRTLTLCHNDLSQGNIFVDAETFKITCIIDWEYSGWFPPNFEAELWKKPLTSGDWPDPIEQRAELLNIGAVPLLARAHERFNSLVDVLRSAKFW